MSAIIRRVSDDITIINTQPAHIAGVCETMRLAYRVPPDAPCPTCLYPADVRGQIERFPAGQFVAVEQSRGGETVVGFAATMRTDRPPSEPPLAWLDAIGGKPISGHDPDGAWLYGVEMGVRPTHQKRGIGTALYEARFAFVRRLNLRGWYAGGMLMGYERHEHRMSQREYGEKVIARELTDPTITMQMNRGFQARAVIDDYLVEAQGADAAILIVWENPDYRA